MSALLLGLLSNPTLLAVLGGLVATVAALMRGRVQGAKREREKAAAEALRAAEDRLEMDREATDAERRATSMTDEEARKEALKWAKR